MDPPGCNYSPILINLEDNSSTDRLTSAQDGVWFDIRANGVKNLIAWTGQDQRVGFLALDVNGNGVIDDGSELFGTATRKRDGSIAKNGFEALDDLDGHPGVRDGRIDANDAVYARLRLWIDFNHNGYSEPNELITLDQAGVNAIFTSFSSLLKRDKFGNWYRYEGTALLRKGEESVARRVFDVFLKTID